MIAALVAPAAVRGQCTAPSGVTCVYGALGAISLTWVNNDIYDSIEIVCNSFTVDTLSGSATSTTVFASAITTCCQIVGVKNGMSCPSALCCVSCPAPTGLVCTIDASGNYLLTWTNGFAYDFIQIFCDGQFQTGLGGTATSFTLSGVSPSSATCCTVVGMIGFFECPSAPCCAGCQVPTNNYCTVDEGVFYLSWVNNDTYDEIRIYCDGVLQSTLPGTATNTVATPTSEGVFCCSIVAVHQGIECDELECCANVGEIGPCPPADLELTLNTGWDDLTGLVIAVGDFEDHWVATRDSSLGGASTPPFTMTLEPEAARVRAPAAGWAGPLPGAGATSSQWIFHTLDVAGIFEYQYCFCLREGFHDPNLTLELLADQSAQVFLNGVFIGGTADPGHISSTSISVTNDAYFTHGLNCLKVVVTNSLGGVTGLNLVGELVVPDGKCCCVPAPHGMVGWWPLDPDSTPFDVRDLAWGNNGTLLNPVYQSSALIDGSVVFDGTNEVQVPDHARLDFGAATGPGSGDLSIDAWIRLDSSAPAAARPIVSKFAGPGVAPGYVLYIEPAGHLAFAVQDGSSSIVFSPTSTAAFVNDNRWHHVAATFDRDHAPNGVRLYVDGQRVDPDNYQGIGLGSMANAGLLRIGAALTFGVSRFVGNIDEVEIFDRVLLAGEVRELAGSGGPAALNGKVLILQSTLTPTSTFVPDNEATLAIECGYQVDIVNDATWLAMTTANFAKYNAIIIGDVNTALPHPCTSPALSDWAGALANVPVWSNAVKGHRIFLMASDPIDHQLMNPDSSTYGAGRRIVKNAICWVASGSGTGLYLVTSTKYHFAPCTTIDILNNLGPFTMSNGSEELISVVNPTHPVVMTPDFVAESDLENWGQSTHGAFQTPLPLGFHKIARRTDNPLPYIIVSDGIASLVRGKCKEYCYVPYVKSVASGGVTTITVQVCNESGATQIYDITHSALAAGTLGCSLPGPTSISHVASVTVPPGCTPVTVTLTAPVGPGSSCFQLCFANRATRNRLCCTGSLAVGAPIVVDVPDDSVEIAALDSTTLVFDITNTSGAVLAAIPIRISNPRRNCSLKIVALDDSPVGTPIDSFVSLGVGESTIVTVDVELLDHEPLSFHDIVLEADFLFGLGYQPLAAIGVKSLPATAVVEPLFRRGDCNSDGGQDISDAITQLSFLFPPVGGSPVLTCLDACDANDDGALDIADAIATLSSLFGAATTPLPPPYPNCGFDPSADPLACSATPCP
ncbi:MAG: LamG-like jellyroll fold domain-containing protein [Phycisphaerae bacterium]